MYFFNVYFPKVHLSVFFESVISESVFSESVFYERVFSKRAFSKSVFYKRVLQVWKYAIILGPDFFDPKVTKPKLSQTERTSLAHLPSFCELVQIKFYVFCLFQMLKWPNTFIFFIFLKGPRCLSSVGQKIKGKEKNIYFLKKWKFTFLCQLLIDHVTEHIRQ